MADRNWFGHSQVNYQNWRGTDDPKYGYGSMLDGFKSAVPKGVELHKEASVDVYMGVPGYIGRWVDEAYKVCFTMWETDTLPVEFLRWLPKFDQILVPCQANLELFSKHHENVKYVPLGVDTKFWKPQARPDNQKFRFHAGGSLWRRKGLDLVVEAFNKMNLPDAELHIKAAPHANDVPEKNLGKNVFLHRRWMTKEQQRDWYSLADCFVAPARGEGFGLMPLQAIAMGIPTIITATTGQDQYKHLATGVVGHGKSKAETIGFWDEANVDELVDEMMSHYKSSPTVAAAAAVSGVRDFTWSKAAAKLAASVPVGVLLDNPRAVDAMVMVEMEVTRKCACEVNGKREQFLPGRTYVVSENTYEIMYPSGYVKEIK